MFNVVPRMNHVTYWLLTYIRTKRKDRTFIFMLKFPRNNLQFFTIKNWKSAKISLFDVPEHTGNSLFEDPERSGYSIFGCRSAQRTHITLSGLSECSGHSNKECPQRTRCSNKEYPGCSGTSNNDIFADFQLSIVKNYDFFPQKCQHKNERPILPLCSDISYKPIGNTVHPWRNIEHAIWIFLFEAEPFAHFAKIWGYFACLTKELLFIKYFLQTIKNQNVLCLGQINVLG